MIIHLMGLQFFRPARPPHADVLTSFSMHLRGAVGVPGGGSAPVTESLRTVDLTESLTHSLPSSQWGRPLNAHGDLWAEVLLYRMTTAVGVGRSAELWRGAGGMRSSWG